MKLPPMLPLVTQVLRVMGVRKRPLWSPLSHSGGRRPPEILECVGEGEGEGLEPSVLTAARRSRPYLIVASTTGTDKPTSPIGNGRRRTVTPRHFVRDRAQVDSGTRCTRRSRVAPGEAVRLAEGEAPRMEAPSIKRTWAWTQSVQTRGYRPDAAAAWRLPSCNYSPPPPRNSRGAVLGNRDLDPMGRGANVSAPCCDPRTAVHHLVVLPSGQISGPLVGGKRT
jgi:hypothetical protein